jgi:hypothetical protein
MAYCEDYPCCGHTRLDPCPGEPVVMTAEEFEEANYCDDCGFAHLGLCFDYEEYSPEADGREIEESERIIVDEYVPGCCEICGSLTFRNGELVHFLEDCFK